MYVVDVGRMPSRAGAPEVAGDACRRGAHMGVIKRNLRHGEIRSFTRTALQTRDILKMANAHISQTRAHSDSGGLGAGRPDAGSVVIHRATHIVFSLAPGATLRARRPAETGRALSAAAAVIRAASESPGKYSTTT